MTGQEALDFVLEQQELRKAETGSEPDAAVLAQALLQVGCSAPSLALGVLICSLYRRQSATPSALTTPPSSSFGCSSNLRLYSLLLLAL